MESSTASKQLDIHEKYESLRERLAYYLLIQVYTFLQTSGISSVPDAMKRLVEKASDMNVEEAKQHTSEKHAEVLANQLVRHMGETFSSKYHVEKDERRFNVVLERCGCIESVIKHSKDFGLGENECRAIFCGTCMGGYRKAAEKLGLNFDGALSRNGCHMDFIEIGH